MLPSFRIYVRPMVMGYRPLKPLQPTMRSFSSHLVRFNQHNSLPTKETPSQSRIMRFIQQSKELVRFYKDGLKQIWFNHKETKALLERVNNEGYALNRAEFQLIHQTKKDMVKLVPFGIVFLILPESIPLLVIYAPGMVPSTCLKENQILKQRQKLDKVRQKMTHNVLKSAKQLQGVITAEDFMHKAKFQRIAKNFAYDFDLSRIDRRHLSSYCKFMGINDYGPQFILKKRLEKYMNYLDQDDKLLLQDNTVDTLTVQELSHAVEERGMKSVDQQEENMRRALKYWLSASQADPKVPAGLLIFSRMFLLNANYV